MCLQTLYLASALIKFMWHTAAAESHVRVALCHCTSQSLYPALGHQPHKLIGEQAVWEWMGGRRGLAGGETAGSGGLRGEWEGGEIVM